MFDDEIRALLGPRPPMRPGIPSAANRAWDLAYAALFPSELLPAFHPSRRKAKTEAATEAAASKLLAKDEKKAKVRHAA
jgi:hypothetical protein